LLDVFEAEQHLIFGQCLGPAAKTVPLQFLMIWRSRSLSHRSASSIAFSISGSSGSASFSITKSDHMRAHFATIPLHVIHFAAGINRQPGCVGVTVSRAS
jgi:hypothetical protein